MPQPCQIMCPCIGRTGQARQTASSRSTRRKERQQVARRIVCWIARPLYNAAVGKVATERKRHVEVDLARFLSGALQTSLLQKSFVFVAMLVLFASKVSGQGPDLPRLETNQAYVEEVRRPTALAITDPIAVFEFVFAALPDRVMVFPTENYFYFSFLHDGVRFAGNIRIEPQESGGQIVHFTYYEDTSEWREDTPEQHVILDGSRGVGVEKLDSFHYRISHNRKSVLFALNDLSHVKPPVDAIAPGERFIGPIFDESGVRFFLLFNPKLKVFHYILDETDTVGDQFFSPQASDRVLIGKRTGFAFYRDHHHNRKIMIGAHEANMRVNNYFDGPFDQLPDNFIEGEALREAILQVQPNLKGRIDRFGSDPGGELRFTIDPYLPYRQVEDLYPIDRCARSRIRAPNYYACFSRELEGLPPAVNAVRRPHRKTGIRQKSRKPE
jgi:hypothetical protein